MSTFTNVLQQRINALENQIRNLQEQNNNLRRRARYLLEAAPSADMPMLSTDVETPSQVGASGAYNNQIDRTTMNAPINLPSPNKLNPGTYDGPPGASYRVTNDGKLIVTWSTNPLFVLGYYWDGSRWVLNQ